MSDKAQETLLVLRGQNEISQNGRVPSAPSVDNHTESLNGYTNVDREKSIGQSEQFHDKPASDERTRKRASSWWSQSEKRQLRDFLATRQHLSWSRIAHEYEERYHKGRSSSSIAGQAHSMGISPGNKRRKPRGKLGRREHLVLRVPSLPSQTRDSSDLGSLPDGSLHPTSGGVIEKATTRENLPHHPQAQGEPGLLSEYGLSSRDAAECHSFDNVAGNVQNETSKEAGALFSRILN